MEVHHHSHTPHKKWTHYFWEFLMLFLAVLCGFTAENIREHQIEHKRAKKYAQLLKIDLRKDTQSLNDHSEILRSESAQQQFVDSLFNMDWNTIRISDLRNRDTMSFSLEYFQPNNATFEQMKTSGELRYFTDIDLISRLAQYDWSIKRSQQMKKEADGLYGGLASEHLLAFEIAFDDFLEKTKNADPATPVIKAGYTFKSWKESKKLAENRSVLKWILLEGTYPELKTQAVEIIEILNKKYHLK